MGNRSSKARVAAVAGRQKGRITWAQLRQLGVSKRTIVMWLDQGYLHRLLPRVYAVGHSGPSYEADLAAALLYAGPGAMLSHATAAHWLGLFNERPGQIHISTPRQTRSQPGVKVHSRRTHPRTWHNGLPTTALPRLFLDLAATMPLRTVRLALARADYKGILDLPAINAALTPGQPGVRALRQALRDHQPDLARTKSDLEVRLVELSESARFPLPELNVKFGGWEVDALWRDKRIAVELDGYGNHRSPAQVKRDRRKELALRKLGLTPVRYSDDQLKNHRDEVIADIRRLRGEDDAPDAAQSRKP